MGKRLNCAAGLSVLAASQGASVEPLQNQVAQDHPAIVWGDCFWRQEPATQYMASDGTSVPYAGPAEHTVVVTGFSNGSVTVNAHPAVNYPFP